MENDPWNSIRVGDMLFGIDKHGKVINCWTWRCFVPDEFDVYMKKGAVLAEQQAKERYNGKDTGT